MTWDDLQKYSIKDTVQHLIQYQKCSTIPGTSRKKHEDPLECMYKEVDDSVRGERGMQRLASGVPLSLTTLLVIQREAKLILSY